MAGYAFLPKYDDSGPSSRVRSYIFYKRMIKKNLRPQIFPFFPAQYIDFLQKKSLLRYLYYPRAILDRLSIIRSIERGTLILIEKELLPGFPYFVERHLLKGHTYCLDYDDAIHVHRNRIRFLRGKCEKLARSAKLVFVGSTYLEKYFRRIGCRAMKKPSFLDRFEDSKLEYDATLIKPLIFKPLIIGWIGQTSTSIYLNNYIDLFEKIFKRHNVLFIFMGANINIERAGLYVAPWSPENEKLLLANLDVGIMPLPLTSRFEKGKSAYKIIQYLSAGVPFVTSAVGESKLLGERSGAGFVCETERDWEETLEYLIDNESERIALGARGQRYFDKEYGDQAIDNICDVLTGLGSA